MIELYREIKKIKRRKQMQLKIKTEELKDLVGRAQKAARIIPEILMTTFLQIEVKNKVLSLSGFDGMNYFKFIQKTENEDSLFAVKADMFFKIFSKTTSKEISLEDKENYILFKGNGSYKLDKEIDKSTDEPIILKFPELKLTNEYKIKTVDFKKAMNRVLPGVSEVQTPIFLAGVLGRKDKLTAATEIRGIQVEVNLFNQDVLLSPEFVKIIQSFKDEYFSFGTSITEGVEYCIASCIDGYVIGAQVSGIKDYPAEQLDNVFNISTDTQAKFKKSDLISVIDRFAIFTDRIGGQGVEIAVNNDSLILRKEEIGEELIPLKDVKNFKSYSCKTDILVLKKLIEKADTEELTFIFGENQFLMFQYENTKLLLSTTQEEN